MPTVKVTIGKRKLLLEKVLSKVPETSGACVLFVGVVREREEGKKVEKLEYTTYATMARRVLREICTTVAAKYGVDAIYVHHRIGNFKPGEPTVYIIVFAPHRNEAFASCREVLEQIKQKVPIWKKEYIDGVGKWK